MIVPADSAQTTRLLALGSRSVERYYRVRFIPVMPQSGDQFALTDQERERYVGAMSASLTFMAAFGAIVVVRPTAPVYDTRLDDGIDSYRVRNAGNTMITLTDLQDCDTAGQDCSVASLRRVLPGSQLTLAKQAQRRYQATLVEGAHTQRLNF
jgi:hypothetical protein